MTTNTTPERPSLRWTGVCLGCADADELAQFYSKMLGCEITARDGDDWIAMRDPAGGVGLNFQAEAWYQPPVWPEQPGAQTKMLHFEIQVAEMEPAVAYAVAAGARIAPHQPADRAPDELRVKDPPVQLITSIRASVPPAAIMRCYDDAGYVRGVCLKLGVAGTVVSWATSAAEVGVKNLPKTEHALLLRTDFSHDAAWARLCTAVQEPSEEGFKAFVDCMSDAAYEGLTVEQLVALALQHGDRSFALLADRHTLSNPEQPVLVVDVYDQPGRTFRVIPRELWSVENNLSLANMDFDDFAANVDPDGVFRGFPHP